MRSLIAHQTAAVDGGAWVLCLLLCISRSQEWEKITEGLLRAPQIPPERCGSGVHLSGDGYEHPKANSVPGETKMRMFLSQKAQLKPCHFGKKTIQIPFLLARGSEQIGRRSEEEEVNKAVNLSTTGLINCWKWLKAAEEPCG